MPADLHLHSIYSDGSYQPETLVKRAKDKGLTTIALADHDTVAGIDQAIKAGEENGLKIIPAIEFSTFKARAEIHILGYYLDHHSDYLHSKIDRIFQARIERAREMVKKLNDIGVGISFKDVEAIAGDKYVGRPHIARALQAAGYINEMGEAFTEEFIGNGGKAYVPKFKLSPIEAINLIKEVGGIPVLAHPYFINHGQPFNRQQIIDLKSAGLMGIEAYHSKHNLTVTKNYLKIAAELSLLVTGGSDFHGENSPDIKLGDIQIEDELVEWLEAAYKEIS